MVHMYIVKNTTIFLIVRLLLLLYLSNSKRTIRNIVVFLTIYICTINLLLLFDNTTGMTHLKDWRRVEPGTKRLSHNTPL